MCLAGCKCLTLSEPQHKYGTHYITMVSKQKSITVTVMNKTFAGMAAFVVNNVLILIYRSFLSGTYEI